MAQSLRQNGQTVVTVANRKGGVGKTSSVIQIASGLSRKGNKVLVIDGDPQGNLSQFFGREGRQDLAELLVRLKSSPAVTGDDFIIRNVRRGLDLLPSFNRDLRLDVPDTAIREARAGFAALVSALKERYDWILIDSSPANSQLEQLLIMASDAVIIPLEFQLFSVSGLESIIGGVRSCSEEAGRNIRVHSLIFTKAENKLNRVQTYREVFSSFHIPIFEICKSEYLTRSLEKSRTIWECGPASYAARDYERIIEKGFLETQ